MGFIYNRKIGFGYKSEAAWTPTVSLQRTLKVLTPQNQQFLARLGLRLHRVYYFVVVR